MPGSMNSLNRPSVRGRRIGASILSGPPLAEDSAAQARWNVANGKFRGYQPTGGLSAKPRHPHDPAHYNKMRFSTMAGPFFASLQSWQYEEVSRVHLQNRAGARRDAGF